MRDPATLTTAALLSDVLRAGEGGASLCRELSDLGVWRLAGQSPDDFERMGLSPTRASQLAAALELGRRVLAGDPDARPTFSAPSETALYLLPRYSPGTVERFGVLALDVRRRLIREQVVSVGCLTASLVHPREVFAVAISCRAAALVLFHNHPSGDPEPSHEDMALTRRLSAAGSLLGIEVLDHLVLGAGRYVSLKERGVL